MFKSLLDRARMFTKRIIAPKENTSRPRPSSRIRLTLEAIEERTLLSASGTEAIPPLSVGEAEHFVAQEATTSEVAPIV